MRARRWSLDERREDLDRPTRETQDLDVVQHEDEIAPPTGQRIRGARHGGAKVLGLVIGAMQGDPGERALVVLGPLQQRGRLAVAGRRHQDRQGNVADLRQPPHETRASDEALAELGVRVRVRRGQYRQALPLNFGRSSITSLKAGVGGPFGQPGSAARHQPVHQPPAKPEKNSTSHIPRPGNVMFRLSASSKKSQLGNVTTTMYRR